MSAQTQCLSLEFGGDRRRFSKDSVLIGRAGNNDLVLRDPRVSSLHGRALRQGDAVHYEDLGSTNGSAIDRDGQRIPVPAGQTGGVALEDGDRLLLGDAADPVIVHVHLEASDQPASPPTGSVADTLIARYRPDAVLEGRADAAVVDREAMARLLGTVRGLGRQDSVAALVDKVADYVLDTMPRAERVALLQVDDPGKLGELTVLADHARGRREARCPVSQSLVAQVVSSQEAMLFGDVSSQLDSDSAAGGAFGSALLAPLFGWESGDADRVVAVLQVTGPVTPAAFGRDELERLSLLACYAGDMIGRVRLLERLRSAEAELLRENEDLKKRLDGAEAGDLASRIVGVSPAIRQVRRSIELVAHTTTSVLITGETGTGKEVVARAIHDCSDRSERRFAAVNCGAIPENLLESELFGHNRGAFTGAVRDRKGLFREADGGTVFLDEIGEMPLSLQVKLLRVLQEGEVTPVGAMQPVPVDVRLVAATNRDLEKEVAEGRFREDLYYRIHVFPMRLPPLRERREDIVALAQHFIERLALRMKRPGCTLGQDALAALSHYEMPGNARELINELERALLFAEPGETIGVARLSERVQGAGGQGPVPAARADGLLKDVVRAYETEYLRAVLEREGGNRSAAARKLGISRQALIVKIQKYGLK